MTIDKAIEILTDRSHNITTTHHEDLIDALKLGVEALNRFQKARPYNDPVNTAPLPGEDS